MTWGTRQLPRDNCQNWRLTVATETIQQQLLKLELGDDFQEFWNRTESYVKGLIGKPWWVSTKQLLECEGPLGKMVEHCLVYVVEKNDRIEGYKAYTNYLTSEYGTSLSRLHNYDLGVLDNMAAKEGDQSLLGTQSPNERKVSQSLPKWLSKEQADFLFMHHKMGMKETAEIVGLSQEQAWTRYSTIKRKVARHSDG